MSKLQKLCYLIALAVLLDLGLHNCERFVRRNDVC